MQAIYDSYVYTLQVRIVSPQIDGRARLLHELIDYIVEITENALL